MTVNQRNKLDMYLAVQAVVGKNQEIWKNLPAFTRGVSALGDAIREIQHHEQVQEDALGGGADKARVAGALNAIAFEVAAAVRACALVAGDETLAADTHFTRTELKRTRSAALAEVCRDIHKAAVGQAALLVDYGVTEEKIGRLLTAIKNFETLQSMPREKRVAGTSAGKRLIDLFRDGDLTLSAQLGGLCVQFMAEHVDFCEKFEAARSIVARRATLPGPSQEGADPKPQSPPTPVNDGAEIEAPKKAA